MEKEKLLENYFSHLLTPEQEKLFEDLLATDRDFRQQFEFEKNLKGVIQHKEKKDLKATLNRFESDIREKSSARPKRDYKNWAMAASVLLLIGLGWLGYYNFGTNYNTMFEENFQQYPNTVFSITRGNDAASLEREAFAAYESGNFQNALDIFDKISQNDQKPYLDFYKAQSYLQLGKTEEAKNLFIKNIQDGTAFVPESHWYLALTFLKNKDKEKAIRQLQELTSLYDYNKIKAKALLQDLE